jgi:hypothetical protein
MHTDLESAIRLIEHLCAIGVVWAHRHDLVKRVRQLEKAVFGAATDATDATDP